MESHPPIKRQKVKPHKRQSIRLAKKKLPKKTGLVKTPRKGKPLIKWPSSVARLDTAPAYRADLFPDPYDTLLDLPLVLQFGVEDDAFFGANHSISYNWSRGQNHDC